MSARSRSQPWFRMHLVQIALLDRHGPARQTQALGFYLLPFTRETFFRRYPHPESLNVIREGFAIAHEMELLWGWRGLTPLEKALHEVFK